MPWISGFLVAATIGSFYHDFALPRLIVVSGLARSIDAAASKKSKLCSAKFSTA